MRVVQISRIFQKQNNVEILQWSSHSPDLSPIEHAQDTLACTDYDFSEKQPDGGQITIHQVNGKGRRTKGECYIIPVKAHSIE